MTSWRSRLIVALALDLALAPPALAGAPTDQLRSQVDRVIKTLEDPAAQGRGQGPGAAEDGPQASPTRSSTSGRRPNARSGVTGRPARPTEREEFVQLFSDLLERSYISKIELFNGERSHLHR